MSFQALQPGASLKDIVTGVNNLLRGKMNVVTSITLTASATSTVINDPRIGAASAIILIPRTANAAAAYATTFIGVKGKETATITHASTSATDRTFDVVILG